MVTSESITEAEKFGLEAGAFVCYMMRYFLPSLFYFIMIFRYVKAVVRICYGREGWQAVRSAGLGSIGVCGTCFRRPLGLRAYIEFLSVFHNPRTSTACGKTKRRPIPTELFSPNGLVRVRNGVLLMRSRELAGLDFISYDFSLKRKC